MDTFSGKSKTKRYSDFDLDFMRHPFTKDIVKVTDENSIKQAFLTLLQTDKGERVFRPWLGSDINSLLFEQMDTGTAVMLEYKIDDLIHNFEPRVVLHDVVVRPNYDDNAYDITIGFSIVNVPGEKEMTLQLERIR
jgi:phage baseplate assembly protein W